MVKEGTFRQDLFYRINVIKLTIPPLRKRKEDIPLLVKHFIEKFNRLQGKEILDVSPDVMKALMQHDYPGNVRELENIIEHAFVLCNDVILRLEHLPSELQPSTSTSASIPKNNLQQLEADFLLAALEKNGWNREKTAAELGMHKSTLFRKIKKLNLSLPSVDGRSNQSR